MAQPIIAYADGVDSALTAPADVAGLLDVAAEEIAVLLGWMVGAPPWIDTDITGATTMVGAALRSAVAEGRIRYVPTRLSAVPRLLADTLRPTAVVVSGVRRGEALAYRGTVGWAPAACRVADAVVVEVDDSAPDLGAPLIEGPVVAVVERPDIDVIPAPRSVDDIDRAVGRNVVELLPDGATLQLGPGGIAEAILEAIERPVRIWSGLITDSIASLAERGLLDGTATAGYVWGGEPIARLADRGLLRLVPTEESHDVSHIASIPRFVGCNTALEVGIDGSVNVERVRGRTVAGIGGHADFCGGAARSPGGLSVIALRSTGPRGHSSIVPEVEVVSTPRCDVDAVVTEHGVADLRGLDDAERRDAIAAIAAPEHHSSLA